MPVIVLLSSDVHSDVGARHLLVERIDQALREWNVALRPMLPDTRDAQLSRYYTIDVSDRDTADEIISSLSRFPGIEAAYWKPADEAP